MRRMSFLLAALFFLTIQGWAQTHFQKVWSTPFMPMNIYVTDADINGTNLQSGDEIGIFDGTVCVAAGVLTAPIAPTAPLSMIASSDDPTTAGVDGFVSGHTMSFKIWKQSSNTEYPSVEAVFTQGNATFAPLGTSVVDLHAYSNTIQVTAPNGGENYTVGTAYNITWTKTGTVALVNIKYSTNNGTAWIDVANNVTASLGTYSWTTPNTPTAQALVKIIDAANAAVFDVSNAVFTISAVPNTITVTAPNGGENYTVNTAHNITWTKTGTTALVNIKYSTNNGTAWIDVVNNVTASLGTYSWTVPNTPTTQALVKVIDAANAAVFDVSNAVFTISAVPNTITVTAPNGGENYTVNTAHNITWTKTGTTALVNIKYSTNNGTAWIDVVNNVTASLGTYSWTVPNTPTTQALVKVIDAANAAVFDVSNAVFTISAVPNTITVTAPNGGENYTVNTAHNITWTKTGTVTQVNIKYSTNNGSSWIDVANNVTASLGTYSWTVPNTATTQALVKIINSSDAAVFDVSNAVFTISVSGSAHFAPIWATPFTPMNIYVLSAQIIGADLQAGDEVAIFDGSICVGSGVLTGVIIPSAPLSLVASADDPTTPAVDGFISGHTMSFKFWKAGTSTEYSNVTAEFTQGTASFAALGTSIVNLDVLAANSITVTAPNGGENYTVGTAHNITWTKTGTTALVNIKYSTNNGTAWIDVVNNVTASLGTYSWTVPNTPTTQALVKIIDAASVAVFDVSNAVFTISAVSNTITVTAPNGGENYTVGTPHNITWTKTGTVTQVNIKYSTNNGAAWIDIANNITASLGTYSWTVPNTPTTQAKVKIISSSDAAVFDVSNAVFTISAAGSQMVVSAPIVYANPGETVLVPIMMEDFTNLGAIMLTVSFDPTVLSYVNALNWSPLTPDALANLANGKIIIAWENLTGITDTSEKLVDLQFTFAGDSSAVTFVQAESEFSDADGVLIPVTYVNGAVYQSPGSTLSGTVKYRNSAFTPLNGVTVNAMQAGVSVYSDVTDNSGAYIFPGIVPGTYQIRSLSTALWGGVTSTDALALRRYIVGLQTLDSLQLKSADVNNNNAVTSTDALFIRRRIVGLDNSFIRGDWAFENPTVSVTGALVVKNVLGLCTGDVNGSFVPALLKENNSVSMVFSGSQAFSQSGDQIIPVFISVNSINALTLAFEFPDDAMEIKSISSRMEGLLYSVNNGILTIAWDDVSGITLSEGEPLFQIITSIKTDLNNYRPFTLIPEQSEFADADANVIPSVTVTLPEFSTAQPSNFCLHQNFPNPFNPTTTITFDVPAESHVSLVVFDVLGRELVTLVDEMRAPGTYTAEFNSATFNTGVFFLRMKAGDFSDVKKMVLIR